MVEPRRSLTAVHTEEVMNLLPEAEDLSRTGKRPAAELGVGTDRGRKTMTMMMRSAQRPRTGEQCVTPVNICKVFC